MCQHLSKLKILKMIGLLTLTTGYCSLGVLTNAQSILSNSNGGYKNIVVVSSNFINPPTEDQLVNMNSESQIVMKEALNILEKGKCYSALTNDVNEKKDGLKKWIEKTKPSQKAIGMLLKRHPNIVCLSLCVRSHPFSELKEDIPKGFKQFNIMWIVQPDSKSIVVIAFPTESCVSFYGATTVSDKVGSIEVNIEDIPKYYAVRKVSEENQNIPETHKGDLNETSLFDTILDYHCPSREAGVESKGYIISFTEKIKHKTRRFWADGIRAYSAYNLDSSVERYPKSLCHQDKSFNADYLCYTITLEE